MTLKLRPDRHLPGAYTYLLLTEPFSALRPVLPEADTVKFIVNTDKACEGYYRKEDGFHAIGVSSARVGTTDALMRLTAHEMIHLYQAIAKTTTANTVHNAEFRRIARRVCNAHHFDFKDFMGNGA